MTEPLSEPVSPREAPPSPAADRDRAAFRAQPEAAPGQVTDAEVDAALDAVYRFWKEAHAVLQAYPSRDLARAMLEAAAPGIAAEGRAVITRPLFALAAEWRGLGEDADGMTPFRTGYRAALRKCADELGSVLAGGGEAGEG